MKKLIFTAVATFLIIMGTAHAVFAQHATALAITWTPSGDPPLIFLIERASVAGGPYTIICGGTGQPVCPVAGPTASYVDAAVKAGDIWFYVVVASGPGGVGPLSAEVKVQIPFLPPTTAPSVSAVPK